MTRSYPKPGPAVNAVGNGAGFLPVTFSETA